LNQLKQARAEPSRWVTILELVAECPGYVVGTGQSFKFGDARKRNRPDGQIEYAFEDVMEPFADDVIRALTKR
jgi:hypothetical protein